MSTHYSSLKISFGMFELDLHFLPKGANRIKESKCESWEFRLFRANFSLPPGLKSRCLIQVIMDLQKSTHRHVQCDTFAEQTHSWNHLLPSKNWAWPASQSTPLGFPHQTISVQFNSVQFSRSVVSNSLQPHESQHARPPCPSPTPGVHSNSRPLSRWCHPAISSSVVPFSSCPQSLPASESFLVSQLFAWGGQSRSFSFSITPSKEHPGLISFRMD